VTGREARKQAREERLHGKACLGRASERKEQDTLCKMARESRRNVRARVKNASGWAVIKADPKGYAGYYKYCKGIIIYGNLIQGKGLFAIRIYTLSRCFTPRPSALPGCPSATRKGLFTEEMPDHPPARTSSTGNLITVGRLVFRSQPPCRRGSAIAKARALNGSAEECRAGGRSSRDKFLHDASIKAPESR